MDKEYRNFCSDFMELCKKDPKSDMIIVDAGNGVRRYTYEEAVEMCQKYGSFFAQQGLEAGDCIVTVMPNSVEAVLCFLSAILFGIHYAPLPCTVTKREFLNWIALVKPKLLLKKNGVADFETDLPVYCFECDGDLSWLPKDARKIQPYKSPQVYLMTSGTTGLPKAMSINTDILWSSGKSFVSFYGIEESRYRFWNYLPMSYLGGLFNLALIPLACSGSFVISEPFSGKTVLNFWNYTQKHEVTALWFVPTIVKGLLKMSKLIGQKHPENVAENIQIGFLGTAPMDFSQKQEFEAAFGIRLLENFALSETTFLTAETEANVRYREQGSVGSLLPYVKMKFVPIEGADTIASIWIKTPYLFNGYLSADGIEKVELDDQGYFNTKDLGHLNEDNVLVLDGRDRDIIKRGGLFVSLVEIESLVKTFSGIEEAAAVPISHEFYGEAYDLFVIFNEKKDADKKIESLHLWMLDNVVSYKMPERIMCCREFPRTPSGKIQKKRILESFREV